MWRVGVSSLWVIVDDTSIPRVMNDHAGKFSDTSGTPVAELIPGENVVMVESVVDDATYTAMLADGNLSVIWAEEI